MRISLLQTLALGLSLLRLGFLVIEDILNKVSPIILARSILFAYAISWSFVCIDEKIILILLSRIVIYFVLISFIFLFLGDLLGLNSIFFL